MIALQHVIPASFGYLSYLLNRPNQPLNEVVIKVNHSALVIAWMAINQSVSAETATTSVCPNITSTQLSSDEASKRPRPSRLWFGEDLAKLTLLRGPIDLEVRVADKVLLKNPPPDLVTRHGHTKDPLGIVEVANFVVIETRTMCDLIWQDGRRERVRSSELTPYVNPDEYDCWFVTVYLSASID